MSKIVSKILLILSVVLAVVVIVYLILIRVNGWNHNSFFIAITFFVLAVLQGIELLISYKTDKQTKKQ